jgi:hypothetical protein
MSAARDAISRPVLSASKVIDKPSGDAAQARIDFAGPAAADKRAREERR